MQQALSYYVYVVFLVIGLLGALFVWKFVPETRGEFPLETATGRRPFIRMWGL